LQLRPIFRSAHVFQIEKRDRGGAKSRKIFDQPDQGDDIANLVPESQAQSATTSTKRVCSLINSKAGQRELCSSSAGATLVSDLRAFAFAAILIRIALEMWRNTVERPSITNLKIFADALAAVAVKTTRKTLVRAQRSMGVWLTPTGWQI